MSPHATRSRYVQGCRCEPCRKANRDYQRSYMAEHYQPAGVCWHGYRRADNTLRHRSLWGQQWYSWSSSA